MRQKVVQIGAEAILDKVSKKTKPRKCLTHKALSREAEGTRTLNLRIDSPML